MLARGIEGPADQSSEMTKSERAGQRQSGAQFRMMLEHFGQHPRATRGHRVPGDQLGAAPPPPALEARPVDLPAADPVAPPRNAPRPEPVAPLRPQPVTAREKLSPALTSMMVNPDQPVLEMLPADLKAGDARYNAREATLRDGLNLTEVERRLKDTARRYEVDFHVSDLEGILRNAGYDATHLGSTERYMAAVEKFMGEAENNYRQRSTNRPGSQA